MNKGLEALQNIRCMTSLSQDCPYKESNNLCDIIEKELNALEIIKKEIRVSNNGLYFKHYNLSGHITKEEYDLLKEVLK